MDQAALACVHIRQKQVLVEAADKLSVIFFVSVMEDRLIFVTAAGQH